MTDIVFLPGAAGAAAFWRPLADRLPGRGAKRLLSWPGLGVQAHDPGVGGLDDLVALVTDGLDGPADLIAQSMGGLVAIRVTLAAPGRVRRLVLTATSAGLPVEALGGEDWREDYRLAFPKAAPWITGLDWREDLSGQLATLDLPVLLLWGDADPISPPAVGERLAALLPDARLHVVEGGGHDLALTHADEIAPIVAAFLA